MIISKMPIEIIKDGPLDRAMKRAKTDPIKIHRHNPSSLWKNHNDQKEINYNKAIKSKQKIIR